MITVLLALGLIAAIGSPLRYLIKDHFDKHGCLVSDNSSGENPLIWRLAASVSRCDFHGRPSLSHRQQS